MEKSVGNNEDGNGRVWDKAPLSHSCPSYIILTHPYPKPGIGHVDEYPSSFIEKKKNDKLIPTLSQLECVFMFGWGG